MKNVQPFISQSIGLDQDYLSNPSFSTIAVVIYRIDPCFQVQIHFSLYQMNIKILSIWLILPIICLENSTWQIESYPQGKFSMLMAQKQGPILSYNHTSQQSLQITLVDRLEDPKRILKIKLALPFQFFPFKWISLDNITLQMNYSHHSSQNRTQENHNYYSVKQSNITIKFHSLIIIKTDDGNLIVNLDGQGIQNMVEYNQIIHTLNKTQKIQVPSSLSSQQPKQQASLSRQKTKDQKKNNGQKKKYAFYLIFSGITYYIYILAICNQQMHAKNQFFRLSIQAIYLFNEFIFFSEILMLKNLPNISQIILVFVNTIKVIIIVIHEGSVMSQCNKKTCQFVIRYAFFCFLFPFVDNQTILSSILLLSLYDSYELINREQISLQFREKTYVHIIFSVGSLLVYQKIFGLQGYDFFYKPTFYWIYIFIGVQTILIFQLKHLGSVFIRRCKWTVYKKIKDFYSIIRGRPTTQENICRICYRYLMVDIDEHTVKGSCGHHFHRNCFGQNIPKECPVDNAALLFEAMI